MVTELAANSLQCSLFVWNHEAMANRLTREIEESNMRRADGGGVRFVVVNSIYAKLNDNALKQEEISRVLSVGRENEG